VIRTPNVGTVITPATGATTIIKTIGTGILNVSPGGGPAGGFIAGGLGVQIPHDQPRASASTPRRRRSKVNTPVDPLDELLHPSGTASRRRAATPSERTDS
jgi:hypothetical protein